MKRSALDARTAQGGKVMVENYMDVLKNNATIPTERLLLRRFRDSDAEDVLSYAGDELTVKYLTWEGIKTLEQAKDIIHSFYCREGVYAIELKENGHCIGAINLHVKPEHEKAGFGYVLNRKYWNHGYMTEALLAILEMAFEKLELNRVEATHYVGNEGSGRVMEKCGLMKEGLALAEVKIKGVFRDVVHYAITREQWNKRKAG